MCQQGARTTRPLAILAVHLPLALFQETPRYLELSPWAPLSLAGLLLLGSALLPSAPL